jgi:hypothetical protein
LIGESEASRERRGRRFLEPLSATANDADNEDSPAQSFVSEDSVLVTAVFLVVVAQLTLGFHSHAGREFFTEAGLNWNWKLANELYERGELACVKPWPYTMRDDFLKLVLLHRFHFK